MTITNCTQCKNSCKIEEPQCGRGEKFKEFIEQGGNPEEYQAPERDHGEHGDHEHGEHEHHGHHHHGEHGRGHHHGEHGHGHHSHHGDYEHGEE